MNIVRAEPSSAIVYRGLGDYRRLLNKNPHRYDQFYVNVDHANAFGPDNIQGPAHGFLSFLQHLGCHAIADGHIIRICHTETGRIFEFLKGSEAAFKNNLQMLAERQMLSTLCEGMQKQDDQGKYCRKDMDRDHTCN